MYNDWGEHELAHIDELAVNFPHIHVYIYIYISVVRTSCRKFLICVFLRHASIRNQALERTMNSYLLDSDNGDNKDGDHWWTYLFNAGFISQGGGGGGGGGGGKTEHREIWGGGGGGLNSVQQCAAEGSRRVEVAGLGDSDCPIGSYCKSKFPVGRLFS